MAVGLWNWTFLTGAFGTSEIDSGIHSARTPLAFPITFFYCTYLCCAVGTVNRNRNCNFTGALTTQDEYSGTIADDGTTKYIQVVDQKV